MVNKDLVRRKLQRLSSYLAELSSYQALTLAEYLADFRNRRAVERLIQVIVDVAVDINSHALVDEGHPPPKDAYDSFIQVSRLGLIPPDFATAIAPSTGERNIIVHEYEQIDDEIVYNSIKVSLEMYEKYVQYCLQFIE